MKTLITISLFSIFNSFAADRYTSCEVFSYQKTINDYEGECEDLILQAATEHKCNTDQFAFIKNKTKYAIQRLVLGSSEYCKMESDNGYYSVMKDDMTEPPVATIFFSRWD